MPLDPAAESHYYHSRQFDSDHNRVVRSHYLKYLEGRGLLVELGCGQGEFLLMASEVVDKVKGVDVDPGMVATARELGIEVELADAADYATTTADRPDVVFAAHFIEHLSVDMAFELLREVGRIVPPGGRVILVTPNPACLAMLTADFWSDPTHMRLYTIELLNFLLDETGFDVVDSGGNPLDIPGPPPQLIATGTLDGWGRLRDELGDSTNSAEGAAQPIDRIDRELTDTVRRLAQEVARLRHVVAALDDRVVDVRHQVQHLLERHNDALAFLYPANEIFVVGERRSST